MTAVLVFASGAVTGALSTGLLSNGPAPRQARDINLPPAIASTPAAPTVTESAPAILPAATNGITESQSTPQPARPSRSGYRGTLQVNSQPLGASVFVNNKYAGQTPLVLRSMPVGSRAVRLDLAGYQPWSRSVRVSANESTTVRAELNRSKTLN